MKKFEFAKKFSFLVMVCLVCDYGFASIQTCRDAIMGIRENLEQISPKTLGAVEALRFVELPAAALKAQLKANLSKDSHLNSQSSDQELSHLADLLMNAQFNHRTVLHIIGRFFYQKDHAEEIAAAKEQKRLAQIPANREAVLATAKSYLDSEWGHFDIGQRASILTFIEHSVLSDPEFQNDPRNYLATWQSKRGGLEMLMLPEDPAQGFLEYLDRKDQLVSFAQEVKASGFEPRDPNAVLSAKWNAEGSSQINSTVQDYVNKDWSHFNAGQRQGIVDFIVNSVLTDPEFQKNPMGYLQRWHSKRGGLDMLMLPHDPAMRFLETLAHSGQLDAFASMVKSSGLKPREPKQVLSAEWTKAGRDKVMQTVNEYLNKDWSHLEASLKSSIASYLEQTVFPDPAFKSNPVQYLTKWNQDRGGLDMLMIPQDPAMRFLIVLFRNQQLVPFAAKVRDAGF